MLIDWLVMSIAQYVIFFLGFALLAAAGYAEATGASDFVLGTSDPRASIALLLASTSLAWGFDSYGWSPGKAATGIRTVRLDSRRPGMVHGLVRQSMRSVGVFAFGLGYLWAIWDDRNQAWHDKLAGTVVVRADPLKQRFPERRPLPLVTRPRIWWLAAVGVLVVIAVAAFSIWVTTTFDEDFWESERFAPQRTGDSPRIHHPLSPALFEVQLARLED